MSYHPSRARRRILPAAVACLALLAVSGAPLELAAQAGRVQASGADALTRRIETVEPKSGPPGTVVTVASGLMPHITPVRIGLGGTRSGFEAMAELLTSGQGDFTVAITVPDWARWDRTHRFIVFDFYFNPIALSDPFFVTDERGMLRREGLVATEPGRCAAIRDVDGQLFTLVGETGTLEEGERIIVEGTLADGADCEHEPTLRVVDVRPAPAGR